MRTPTSTLLAFFMYGYAAVSGLYSSEDPGIYILRQSTFDSLVLRSDSAWVVQFYNPRCGHCVGYAPTYKALAKDLLSWSNVIKLGVVDCTELASHLCGRYGIRGTPTFRLFGPLAASNESGVDVYLHSVSDWRNRISAFLYHVPHRPSFWPEFSLTSYTDTKMHFNELANQAAASGSQFLGILIAEPADSSAGVALILDTMGLKRNGWLVAARRAPTAGDNQPVNSLQIHRYLPGPPATFELVDSGHYGKLRPVLASLTPSIQTVSANSSANVTASTVAPRYHNHVDLADLEAGLYVLLVEEVNTFEDLDANRLLVLRRFLVMARRTLRRVLPDYVVAYLDSLLEILDRFGISNVHSAASERIELSIRPQLHSCAAIKSGRRREAKGAPDKSKKRAVGVRLENITIDIPLNRSEWLDVLVAAHKPNRSAFLPVPRTLTWSMWTGCRGSEASLRGYSCSLWQLFHTMSVQQAVLAKRQKSDEKALLVAIRDFVLTFFTCRECASNFRHEAASLDNVTKFAVGEGALWLWRVHNSVNARLSREASGDPVYPKRLFPTSDECPRCYVSSRARNVTSRLAESGLRNETVVWNLNAVSRYLEQVYGVAALRKSPVGLHNPSAITRRHKCGENVEFSVSASRNSLDAPSAKHAASGSDDKRGRNRRSANDYKMYRDSDGDADKDESPVNRNDLIIAVVVYIIVFILFVLVYLSFIMKRGQRTKLIRRTLSCECSPNPLCSP